jgi:hypothetical protein
MTSTMYRHARCPATPSLPPSCVVSGLNLDPRPLPPDLVPNGDDRSRTPAMPRRPPPSSLPARQPPDPFHSSGRVGGVGRMAGCTSRRTSRLGGGAWLSVVARMRDRIAPQSCQPGGAQSCPRRRTPQRTPQAAPPQARPARWSAWTSASSPRRPPRWSTWTRKHLAEEVRVSPRGPEGKIPV